MRRLVRIALLCLEAGAAAAAPAPEPTPALAASVNGAPITRATLEQALALRAPGATATAATRATVRNQLIAEELLWQKANQTGQTEATDRQSAIMRYIAGNANPRPIDEQDLRAKYAHVVASLGTREYRISLIQTADRDAMRKAQQALQHGDEFARVAARFSHAPSARRGGELDWVSFQQSVHEGRTNGIPLPIARAVAAMKPGQVTAPIELANGWALVRLDGERATMVPAYETVRAELHRRLAAQALEAATRAFVVTLLKDAQIKVFE
jgi:parvulin-like peptidyl-prolyl isomerase